MADLGGRLVDAIADLDSDDRAFVDLWVSGDLGDEPLADRTGARPEVVNLHRDRIITRLSEILTASEPEVRRALDELAASHRETPATPVRADSWSEPTAEPPIPVRPPPPSTPPPRFLPGHWALWVALVVVVVVLIGGVVPLLVGGNAGQSTTGTGTAVGSTTP
jgi:hypothetical protein